MTHDTPKTPPSPSQESAPGARKVVAGVDGSAASRAAMKYAAQQAALRHADLEVVMAWDWPLAYARAPMLHESDPVGEARKEFEAVVASLVKDNPQLTVTTAFVHGHPAQTLVEASKGADLLVVGSRGHGEFVGMVLGSVGQYCAAHAHCPVLIHRSSD